MSLYIIDHCYNPRGGQYLLNTSGRVDNDGSSQQRLLGLHTFEFPADDLIRLQIAQTPPREVEFVWRVRSQSFRLILRGASDLDVEEEIESGIYEMCDMLLLTKEKSKKARLSYHDVLQIYQANHTLDDTRTWSHLQLSNAQPYNCPPTAVPTINFGSDMEKMFRRLRKIHQFMGIKRNIKQTIKEDYGPIYKGIFNGKHPNTTWWSTAESAILYKAVIPALLPNESRVRLPAPSGPWSAHLSLCAFANWKRQVPALKLDSEALGLTCLSSGIVKVDDKCWACLLKARTSPTDCLKIGKKTAAQQMVYL